MECRIRSGCKKAVVSAMIVCLAAAQIASVRPAQALGPVDYSTLLASQVVDEIKTAIAPGLTQKEFIYRNKDGDRVTCFTLEYTPKNGLVTLAAGTPNDGTAVGLATVRDQASAAANKGERVVAAINADMYDMKTGDPWGVVVKNGTEIHSYAPVRTWWDFFGVRKDGSPIYGDRKTYEDNKGVIQQALGIHSILVENGAILNADLTPTLAPRCAVGVRNDQSVFFLLADGRKDPYSHGLTLQETAQLMQDLGAVWAGNLDGGGSSTLLTRTPGETGLPVRNYPSEGKERPVANSWLFLENPVPGGGFYSASLSPGDKTYAPGSVVRMSAEGLDFSGAPAPLPASGLTWQLSDTGLGSIDQNGVFSSSGGTGQAQVQLFYNGRMAGSTYIEIESPDGSVPAGAVSPSAGTNAGYVATYHGREVTRP